MLLLTMLRTLNTAAKVIDNRANCLWCRVRIQHGVLQWTRAPAGNAVTL